MRVWCGFTAFLLALSIAVAAAQSPPAAPTQSQHDQTPMTGDMGAHKPAPPAGPLVISYGDQLARWTAATLAGLPQTTVKVFNEHTKANETYAGVPLIDLLAKLGVPDKPRGKQFRIYVVAAGSDGYEVVYSLGEITPDVHDATVLVADSEDGKPIGDDGPLKLVATREKRPARWVRNLMAVKVLTAE
ncbi:MAG TPA: hypothetical protein VL986_04975 [Terracidiphilus sp.]|nr:hypothetical protein [Terracidiphilus sp.]